MAAAALYPGRASTFSTWARTAFSGAGLVDVDGLRVVGPGEFALVEHRTNGEETAGSSTIAALERLAARLKWPLLLERTLVGAVDTRQIIWCLYKGDAIRGVFATTDNRWPSDSAAVARTWRGGSLPPLVPWSTLADRALAAGIPTRTIAIEENGCPRPVHEGWLQGLIR